MRRLVASAASASIITYAYYRHPAPDRGEPTELVDQVILYGVPAVLFSIALVALLSRTQWNIRSIGLLYIVLASAFLLTTITYARSQGADPGTSEFIADLSRACFIIGAPAGLFGVLTWAYFRFKYRGLNRDDDDITGFTYHDKEMC